MPWTSSSRFPGHVALHSTHSVKNRTKCWRFLRWPGQHGQHGQHGQNAYAVGISNQQVSTSRVAAPQVLVSSGISCRFLQEVSAVTVDSVLSDARATVTNCHLRPGDPSFEGVKHVCLAEGDVPNAVVKESWQDLSAGAATDSHCWFATAS